MIFNIMDYQTEIASRSTWENHSINQPIRIPIELSFTSRQVETLKKGHIPIEMKDKWFIFYEDRNYSIFYVSTKDLREYISLLSLARR